MILAKHLKIDAKRRPAGAEIRLPLQFYRAARDRQRRFRSVLIIEGNLTLRGIDVLHRHVQHAPRRRRDRQERRIGRLPLRPQGRQHDIHDVLILLSTFQQRRVELACAIEFSG